MITLSHSGLLLLGSAEEFKSLIFYWQMKPRFKEEDY